MAEQLVDFPPGCAAVTELLDQDQALSEVGIREVIVKFGITLESDGNDLAAMRDEGVDSIAAITAAEAGEADCQSCGGLKNSDRARICSFGAFLTKATG